MLPSLEQIVATHAWLSRRLQLDGQPHEPALLKALEEAAALAQNPQDEPAALFYALARRPKALMDAWGPLTELIALNHARFLGSPLTVEAPDLLRQLCMALVSGRASWEDTRAFFVARQARSSGG